MTDEEAFSAAYDAVLARWPVPVEAVDVPTPFGRTRVHRCGTDGPPLVLLHGGGATSTAWSAVAGEVGRTHRVHAVDQVGDVGRSVPDGRPVRRAEDLTAWLDAVLDGLGLPTAQLVGHSYGGWIALRYALDRPHRVARLALLDPTACFAGYRPTYLLHALPLLVRPTAARMQAFLRWETAGAGADAVPLDEAWLELAALGAALPTPPVVQPRRPRPVELRALTVPVLVLLAERSRAHDVRRVAARARALLPAVTVAELPGATHHTIPTQDAALLGRALLGPG